MVRKYYRQLTNDENVDQATMLSQCADALDQAAAFYHTTGDPEGYLKVANGWLQLSQHAGDLQEAGVHNPSAGSSHNGERQVTAGFKAKVGFTMPEESNG